MVKPARQIQLHSQSMFGAWHSMKPQVTDGKYIEHICTIAQRYHNTSCFSKHADFCHYLTVFPPLDWSCYQTEDTKANVTVLDLKDVYEKGQMRRNASSEQRLLNAEVHLKATAQKPIQVNIKQNLVLFSGICRIKCQ